MKTTPDNEKLLDLVDNARKGKIVLTQFQCNFVWSRNDITALLISILEGHFIGSFLLLDTESNNLPFAARPLESVAISTNGAPDSYGVYAPRTIALICGLDVKSKTTINLKLKNFAADWRRYKRIILKRFWMRGN